MKGIKILPSNQLRCQGRYKGTEKIARVCTEKGCTKNPFVCSSSECNCVESHNMHKLISIQDAFELINKPPKFSVELQQGVKAMKTVFEALRRQLADLEVEHDRLIESHVSCFSYRQTRAKMLAHDNSFPYTGDLISEMLRELGNPSAKYPYIMKTNEITTKILPHVIQRMSRIATVVKEVWQFDVAKSKSTFSVDQTFFIADRGIALDTFDAVNESNRAVVMQRCRIQDLQTIITKFAGIKSLIELAFSDCQLVDSDIAHFRFLRQLERLSLDGNRLTQEVFKLIEPLECLRSLSLERNPLVNTVTVDKVQAFITKMPALNCLTLPMFTVSQLSRENTNLTNRVAILLAKNAPNATVLNLGGNKLSEHCIITVAEHMRLLSNLDVEADSIILSDSAWKTIGTFLPNIQRLSINRCAVTDSGAFQIATTMKNVRQLFASVNTIGPSGAKSITKNMTLLLVLRIACNPIKDDGLSALALITGLRILDIEGCQATSKGMLPIVTNLKQLQQLELGTAENILKLNIQHMFSIQNRMDGEVIQAIGQNLKKLQKLLARGVGMTEDQAAELVRSLPNLAELAIGYNQFPEESLQRIRKLCPKAKVEW